MKTETYILPSHWAPALINDDRSNLTDSDEQELDNWINNNTPGHCVSWSDEQYFTPSNDAHTLPCDVLEFTFSKR